MIYKQTAAAGKGTRVKIIEDAIEPTAEIVDRFKPILNMKASN